MLSGMFETEDFRKLIDSAISEEAANLGVERYQTAIPTYLQGLATGNESILLTEELRKSVGTRRDTADAVRSARILAREASGYALSERRSVLTVADMQKAYQAKFCQVWPFCR
jgi:histone H3/H4